MRELTCAALLILGSGVAHADAITAASSIFANECARCHGPEKLRPKTSTYREPPVGAKAKSHGQAASDPLREWMETSHENDPNTHCHAARLDAVQREVVIAFLRHAENPRARPWAPPRLAPAANGGIAPAPKNREPKLGQGDHR